VQNKNTFTNNLKNLCLLIEPTLFPKFFEILQGGFMVKCRVGISIKTLLCEELGLIPAYVTGRISTIFLDGKPVDDIESAIIKDGSSLALSAAMPGLVGATMRREGVYSSLRSSITYEEKHSNYLSKEGLISLKLYNLLIDELGPLLLKRGIFVKSTELSAFLTKQPDNFWKGCKEMLLDGKPVERSVLQKSNLPAWCDWVYLTVLTG
jgi:hypothetical protein